MMPVQSSMLHVRVDDETKERATEALRHLGLSVSDAVRLFLQRVATDGTFPPELKKRNPETLAAMAEADEIARTRAGRFGSADSLIADLEKAR